MGKRPEVWMNCSQGALWTRLLLPQASTAQNVSDAHKNRQPSLIRRSDEIRNKLQIVKFRIYGNTVNCLCTLQIETTNWCNQILAKSHNIGGTVTCVTWHLKKKIYCYNSEIHVTFQMYFRIIAQEFCFRFSETFLLNYICSKHNNPTNLYLIFVVDNSRTPEKNTVPDGSTYHTDTTGMDRSKGTAKIKAQPLKTKKLRCHLVVTLNNCVYSAVY